MALPALVLLLLAGLTAVNAVTTQLRCVAAARDVALAVARGEPGAEAGPGNAPDGATIVVIRDGNTVRASVRAPVAPVGGLLPGLTVSAVAVAAVEPGLTVSAIAVTAVEPGLTVSAVAVAVVEPGLPG